MKVHGAVLIAVLAVALGSDALAAATWIPGQHYFVVTPVSGQALAAGQREVVEVFSYGCPACAAFNPVAHKLRDVLPKGVRFVYVPASFIPAEDWPMFQRAYFTAEALGIAERTHDAMFDAVWKGGELAITDPATG